MVVAKSDEKKESGEEGNDHDPNGGSREEFEMEMLWAKEPRRTTAEDTSTNLGFLGNVGIGHYKFHKSK
jgi:hypothetical protein